MTALRPTLVALALLLTLAPAPTAAAETPTHGACDETGYLVCAGADVGATVHCAVDAQGLASCSWAYGWLTTAYSPLLLSGRETHVAHVVVSVCGGDGLCAASAADVPTECAWVPATSCDDGPGFGPLSASGQLALGQCFRVSVDLAVAIDATVADGLELATVHFENTGGAAGAACFVDNGR